jgi:hypothetical protein
LSPSEVLRFTRETPVLLADGLAGQLHILPHFGNRVGIRVGVDVRWVPCEALESIGQALRQQGAPTEVPQQPTLRDARIAAAFEKLSREEPA